jgi:hypothetical protein
MVFKNECTSLILSEFPGFASSKEWEEDLKFWEGEEAGLCNEMSTFSDYVSNILNNDPHSSELNRIFSFIENLIINGDQDVRDAATTCFLENLLNYDSAGRVKASTFVHLLGPESKAYCKAWDEFTGVKTPGLWDE